MNYYFGEPWPSSVCVGAERLPTPVGLECTLCREEIQPEDQGTFQPVVTLEDALSTDIRPAHRECSLRAVLGGIGHHEDHSFWCNEMHDPDGGMTKRQSALMVWNLVTNDPSALGI